MTLNYFSILNIQNMEGTNKQSARDPKHSSDLTPDISMADGHALNLKNIDHES